MQREQSIEPKSSFRFFQTAMASIESLLTLPADRAITFANEGDLEK